MFPTLFKTDKTFHTDSICEGEEGWHEGVNIDSYRKKWISRDDESLHRPWSCVERTLGEWNKIDLLVMPFHQISIVLQN